MAKRRRRARRSTPRRARRSLPAVFRRRRRRSSAVHRFRRRRGGGGGGAFGSPFRQGGSLPSRVTGSVLPVAKMVAPIVIGAIGGALLAAKLPAKFRTTTVKAGIGVTIAAILLGIFAKKFGRTLARPAQLAAVGMAADGLMRLTLPLRASKKLPLLPAGNQGLLADAGPADMEVVDLDPDAVSSRDRMTLLAG